MNGFKNIIKKDKYDLIRWLILVLIIITSFFSVKKCELDLVKANTTFFKHVFDETNISLVEWAEKTKCSSTASIRVNLKCNLTPSLTNSKHLNCKPFRNYSFFHFT